MPVGRAIGIPLSSTLPPAAFANSDGITLTQPTPDSREFTHAVELATGVIGHSLTPGTSPPPSEIISSNSCARIQDVSAVVASSKLGIRAAALTLYLPGRVAMLIAGTHDLEDNTLLDAGAAIRAVSHVSQSRGVLLVEALLPPESTTSKAAFERAGFTYLTDLQYLTRNIGVAASLPPFGIKWMPFSDPCKPLFESVIQETYAQTLDCPELTGVRTMPDVLESHRAAGEFHATLWNLLILNEKPVGALLLGLLPAVNSLEIVYVGVVPEARRAGLGRALLLKATELARGVGAKALTLAVDRRNVPARCLYTRQGFREFGARAAWIATPRHR